ncbi:MAG: alpha/beta fold hydrolase, partial [Salinarimonas sp.]|nr:alpha/beta fold hydrolase [Salinarimonas sp.]
MTISFTGALENRLVGDVFHDRNGDPSAPTALLLHGGGQTRHAWGGTAERLAARGWRAIALDQRGHGDSDRIASGAYGFRDFGADARRVAQALAHGSGRAPVAIGASLGGLASILALGDDPGAPPCFSALVLVDIVPQMDPRGVDRIQSFMLAHAADG